MTVPVETTGTALDVVLGAAVPSPAATDGSTAIDARGVIGMHLSHPVVAVADPVARRLVAGSHHDERGVVAVLIDDAARLVEQVLVDGHAAAQLDAVVGPRRSLGLQVDAHLVGCLKGCLGRTVAVEAHVVESVLAALAEDAQPLGLVGGRIARLGEAAVLHRAAQEQRSAVDVELSAADADVAQSKGGLIDVVAHLERHQVEVGLELVPLLEAVAEDDVERHLVAADGLHQAAQDLTRLSVAVGADGEEGVVVPQHAQLVEMVLEIDGDVQGLLPRCLAALADADTVGVHTHLTDKEALPLRLQLHASDDAVPVALRLVGDAMGVLSDADVLDAVIDADGYLVALAGADDLRQVVAVGYGERHLVAHFDAVDKDGGLDVRPLEQQGDVLALPLLRHIDAAAVPGGTDIVALGGEEEGELHLALDTVALHVGVEVVGRVVERARPGRRHADGTALAVGEHGARQHDIVVVVGGVAERQVPGTRQGQNLLCPEDGGTAA